MNLTYAARTSRRSTVLVLGCLLASLIGPSASQAAPELKPMRIKNSRSIRVVLGPRREPAAGIRPEKAGWRVLLAPELAGSAAELQDITPGVPGTQWTLPVAAEGLVLDEERFVPSHVYRLEVRKDDKLVGSAVIYLYPPATPRTEKVEFASEEKAPPKGGPISPTPKGGLSVDRSSGRTRPR
jgi:hypothetical protein